MISIQMPLRNKNSSTGRRSLCTYFFFYNTEPAAIIKSNDPSVMLNKLSTSGFIPEWVYG